MSIVNKQHYKVKIPKWYNEMLFLRKHFLLLIHSINFNGIYFICNYTDVNLLLKEKNNISKSSLTGEPINF